MPDTTGNFQDLLQFSQDTLYNLGEEFVVGNSAASNVTVAFSNSLGVVSLVAAATGNQALYLPAWTTPSTQGTLLSNVNVSAGTTSQNLSNLVFSNLGGISGVSFGLNGSTITAQVVAGGVEVSAGTKDQSFVDYIIFSNSNNVSFGLSGGPGTDGDNAVTITAIAGAAAGSVNFSAGTTSNNLTAVTFANANNVSFGLNGSTITASIPTLFVSALGANGFITNLAFSNSNNVSFGGNLPGPDGTITAEAFFNISAGTTSNNLTAVTFSNSNGVSFGLNGSTVTAMLGGMGEWQNGDIIASFGSSNAFLSLQPIVVPYNLQVTNLVWLAHMLGVSTSASSSGAWTISAGIYTQTGVGTAGTLSLASSSSSQYSYNTAGAQYNSQSGTQYRQMSVSWNLTAGSYVFAFAGASVNGGSHTFYGFQSNVSLVSAADSIVSSAAFVGFSVSSITALPASVGITNTASYVRTGSSAHNQPWVRFLGT